MDEYAMDNRIKGREVKGYTPFLFTQHFRSIYM